MPQPRKGVVNSRQLGFFLTAFFLPGFVVSLLADEPAKKEEAKPCPVEARLIVKQSEYVLPIDRHGKAFRKRIKEETDTDKLPAPPKVDLVFELKNVSEVDVMIWPRGSISYPDQIVEGAGVVGPESLRTISDESSGTSVQPTIAPGKTYRFKIKSLNPIGGTPWYYWCEPGEYTIKATYTVHTGRLPSERANRIGLCQSSISTAQRTISCRLKWRRRSRLRS